MHSISGKKSKPISHLKLLMLLQIPNPFYTLVKRDVVIVVLGAHWQVALKI